MDTEDNDDHQSVPMAQYNVRLVASVKDFNQNHIYMDEYNTEYYRHWYIYRALR